MPLYRYEALDRTGNKVAGVMQVADEAVLQVRLHGMGYRLVHAETAQPASAKAKAPAARAERPQRSGYATDERAVARLFHQLQVAFKSGMGAFQAVSTVSGQVPERSLQRALGEMAQGIQYGQTLSEQMERHPRLFSPGDVGMVRAGEVGGFLPESLQILATQHDQNDSLRRRLGIWVWFFHSNVVAAILMLPLGFFFKDVFPSFNVKVGVASAVRALLVVALPLLVSYGAGLALLGRLRGEPGWAYLWHRFLLKLPVAGKINRLRANAVFSRTLQLLYHAGLPPVTAWETASGAVPNLFLAERFMGGREVMESTSRPSAALERVRMMDPTDLGMVATGESAGEIPQALEYLANRYEEETQVALNASVARGATSFVLWSLLLGAIAFGIVMYFYGQGVLKIGEME